MSFIRLCNGEAHQLGKPFTPDIETIASALSHVNRFNGHVGVYSVAQHCALVALQLPRHLRLAGLLHDAPEAYLGDVTSPLKAMLPEYKAIEDVYHDIIDDFFCVYTRHPEIKTADVRMLMTEVKSFDIDPEGFPDAPPFDFKIAKLPPEMARDMFLTVFYTLQDRPPHLV